MCKKMSEHVQGCNKPFTLGDNVFGEKIWNANKSLVAGMTSNLCLVLVSCFHDI